MIVKADMEFIIWIIIGAFGLISHLAKAAKKTNAPNRPVVFPQKSTNDDPFADLMQKLSGIQEVKPPEPVRVATPPQPEPITPVQHSTPPPLRTPEPEAIHAKIAEVDIRPTMSAFKTTMPSMKLPAMNLSFQTSENSKNKTATLEEIIDLADRTTLRRAILGHIILSKPKGLDGWSGGMMD